MLAKCAVALSLALALGACAQTRGAEQPRPVQPIASAPSPRTECTPARMTLYFSEQVASDEPVVTPLLNDFLDRIHACEAAGGELRSVTITTSADPGQSASAARAQIARRQQRVRGALVEHGVPETKITGTTTSAEAIMGRRAEIAADLY